MFRERKVEVKMRKMIAEGGLAPKEIAIILA